MPRRGASFRRDGHWPQRTDLSQRRVVRMVQLQVRSKLPIRGRRASTLERCLMPDCFDRQRQLHAILSGPNACAERAVPRWLRRYRSVPFPSVSFRAIRPTGLSAGFIDHPPERGGRRIASGCRQRKFREPARSLMNRRGRPSRGGRANEMSRRTSNLCIHGQTPVASKRRDSGAVSERRRRGRAPRQRWPFLTTDRECQPLRPRQAVASTTPPRT
jgi:hypothetical protein